MRIGGVTGTPIPLAALYAERLPLLVRKSPLSHGGIAVVLQDMLESDAVILWQLMGNPEQSAPFEELLGEFMETVQLAAETDPDVRTVVRSAISAQLVKVEGRLQSH